jgi:hypothetical protein
MNPKCTWILPALIAIGMCGCAAPKRQAAEVVEVGETMVRLDQTPAAVRQTIERELVGAQLEAIARKERQGKTIYETDVIRNGHKWEVVIGEDGTIISKLQEGSPEEQQADKLDSLQAGMPGYRETFKVNKADLVPTGNNPYITVQPGRVLKLTDAVTGTLLTLTILPEKKTVDGVACGVLEERETKDGQLIEISRNYFATDRNTGDVYYFGEDVDNYQDGKIISHDSSWLAGENGAKFGLMIPAKARVGDKFFQEIAPKVALDAVEVVSVDETVKTPAGAFQHCVHLRETTPLDPDVSHKYYARGVGLIKDDGFDLVEKP